MVHLTSPRQLKIKAIFPLFERLCSLFRQRTVQLQTQATNYWLNRQLPRLAHQTCAVYLGETGEASQARCRELLQMQLTLSPLQLKRFLQTQIGQTLLTRLSQLIHWPADARSRSALNQALLDMVAHTEKFSVLSLLYQLSRTLTLKTDEFLLTAKQVDLLLETTEDILALLQTLSSQDTAPAALALAPDPRLPGAAGIERRLLTLCDNQRMRSGGRKYSREFRVLLYTPTQWQYPQAPVVVMSHGLAARPDDLAHYAQHLASHGYVVAIPQHPGSDTNQVREMLSGTAAEVFQLHEFIDRPLDITCVLDELERLNQSQFEQRLNLEAVGVLGQSFGGYTALALAGAKIDFDRLEQACRPVFDTLNLSMLLQCRALDLPRQATSLQDPRVRAVLALDPIGSYVFGASGIANINIPVLIATGSEDKTAPMALEPIQIFPWLTTEHAYLAVIRGKSHIHDMSKLLSSLKLKLTHETPAFKLHPPIIDSYLDGLSLTFFDAFLTQQPAARDRLSAAYTRQISQPPYDLYLVKGQDSAALIQPLEAFQQQLAELGNVTIQHSEGLFNASGGFSLYYQSWLPTEALQATLVILHGLGGHSGLFGNVVKALVSQGVGVYSFDARGSGRSPGQRGHVNRWREYREDVAHCLAMVKLQWPDIPCFLMGHSLGGIVALDYAIRHPEQLDGLIVTAPPLGTSGVSGLRLTIGRVLSQLWPRFSLSTGLKHVPPSRDRAVIIAYAHDPLRHCQGTARLATEFIRTNRWLQTHALELKVPLLLLHGSDDRVALIESSRAFFETLTLADKEFHEYAGAYHELHDDINHDEVLSDLARWLLQHVTRANCIKES
ncbi:MAG: alpha/beta fold hydrolase [Leptolyngbya sp. SIO4C1]|nr:alpha/beta fold hydrolase [Leptolyngbya sp. SIO4C1]